MPSRTSPRVVLAVLSAAAGAFAVLQPLVGPVLPTSGGRCTPTPSQRLRSPAGLPTESGFTDVFRVPAGASLTAALLVPAAPPRPVDLPSGDATVTAPVPAGSR